MPHPASESVSDVLSLLVYQTDDVFSGAPPRLNGNAFLARPVAGSTSTSTPHRLGAQLITDKRLLDFL